MLINVSDHFTRTKANSASPSGVRVLGCLLGSQTGRSIDISNSFEIKFETGPAGVSTIDIPFLLKKQEQCETDRPCMHACIRPCICPMQRRPLTHRLVPTARRHADKMVFPKLDLVGWYATGEEITDADVAVNQKIMEYNESPVMLLLNTRIDLTRKDLPITLYETEMHVVDGCPVHQFVQSEYTVETSDAERIGVDQVAKILPSGSASSSEQRG